jgi:hypothetical protein
MKTRPARTSIGGVCVLWLLGDRGRHIEFKFVGRGRSVPATRSQIAFPPRANSRASNGHELLRVLYRGLPSCSSF